MRDHRPLPRQTQPIYPCAATHRPARHPSRPRTNVTRWLPRIALALALSAYAAPEDDASTDAGGDVIDLDSNDATSPASEPGVGT